MRKSDPVCIDQSRCTTKAFSKLVGMIEVVVKDLNALAEGIFPLRMVRQSADARSATEQEPRRVLACVTEGSGYDDGVGHKKLGINSMKPDAEQTR